MGSLRAFTSSNFGRTSAVILLSLPTVGALLFAVWVYPFLKDFRAVLYAGAFVVALLCLLQLPQFVESGDARLGRAAARGLVAGYLAGVVAYAAMAALIPDGAERLGNAVAEMPGGLLVAALGSPIVMGLWAYGAIVGVGVEWLRNWAAGGQPAH